MLLCKRSQCLRKGAAVVELTVMLPLLMLLIGGTIEFGVLLYNKQVVVNASREAARAGSTGNEDVIGIKQIAADYCDNRLIDLTGMPNAPATTAVWDVQKDLTVKVSLTCNLFFARVLGRDSIDVAGRTVMRME